MFSSVFVFLLFFFFCENAVTGETWQSAEFSL